MPRLAERVPAIDRSRSHHAANGRRTTDSQPLPDRNQPDRRTGAIRGPVTSPVSEVVAPNRGAHDCVSSGGLPARLRAGVEALSGIAMDDVRVHRNSAEPAKLGALAFTRGSEIHLGPGQEEHLPHEAWHVVQQKQGRVQATTQMKGAAVNDDHGLEREADRMGSLTSDSNVSSGARHVEIKNAPTPVVQRQPAAPSKYDIRTARLLGERMARRLRTEGVISKEVRAKINRDLACFEGAVKDAYLSEVKPALLAVTNGPPIHGPPTVTWSLLGPNPEVPGAYSDDKIYAPIKEMQEREKNERVAQEISSLDAKASDWNPDDKEFAEQLLRKAFEHSDRVGPKAIHDQDRQPILDRYEQWMRAVDQQRMKRCVDNPPSAAEISRAAFKGDYICVSWFSDKRAPSHASVKLDEMRRSLNASGGYATLVEQVYADVQVYRLQTDPKMIQSQEDAASLVDAIGAFAQVPAGENPAVPESPPPEPHSQISSGARDPSLSQHTDPFTGERRDIVATAQKPGAMRTSIDASGAEFEAWNHATQVRREIGLQAPGRVNAGGQDFLTAARRPDGQMEIIYNDATINAQKVPKTSPPASWVSEAQAAVDRVNIGDPQVEAEIRAAFAARHVRIRTIWVQVTPQGTVTFTGF